MTTADAVTCETIRPASNLQRAFKVLKFAQQSELIIPYPGCTDDNELSQQGTEVFYVGKTKIFFMFQIVLVIIYIGVIYATDVTNQ